MTNIGEQDGEKLREYRKEVESVARECIRQAREYDEDLSDVIHENVDGHQFIIYTAMAMDVIRYSDQDGPDLANDMGGLETDDPMFYEKLAFLCMRADVEEQIAQMRVER